MAAMATDTATPPKNAQATGLTICIGPRFIAAALAAVVHGDAEEVLRGFRPAIHALARHT